MSWADGGAERRERESGACVVQVYEHRQQLAVIMDPDLSLPKSALTQSNILSY